MPDSSDIDTALLQKLSSDATLLGYVPNGVYWDVAPPGSKQFVIVSLVQEADVQQFQQRSYEDTLYMVKTVILTTVTNAGTLSKQAAARLDVLLEQTLLTATGYGHMLCRRETRVRFTETDDVDPTLRWYHRGGHYRVVMST